MADRQPRAIAVRGRPLGTVDWTSIPVEESPLTPAWNDTLAKERKRKRDIADLDLKISTGMKKFAKLEKEANEHYQKAGEYQQKADDNKEAEEHERKVEGYQQMVDEHKEKAKEARQQNKEAQDKAEDHQQKATKAISEAMKTKEEVRKDEKKKKTRVKDGSASNKAIEKDGTALVEDFIRRFGLPIQDPTCTSIP